MLEHLTYGPKRTLQDMYEVYFYFKHKGERVGHFTIRNRWPTAEVWAVMIFEPYRGRGLGKLMMQQAVTLCRRMGFKHMWLNVDKNNTFAKRCYRAAGFKLVLPGFTLMEGHLDLEKRKARCRKGRKSTTSDMERSLVLCSSKAQP